MKGEGALQGEGQPVESVLAAADARIAWVLDHPHTSDWLKQALRTAAGLDPMTLRNDLEMLECLLLPQTRAQIELALGQLLESGPNRTGGRES